MLLKKLFANTSYQLAGRLISGFFAFLVLLLLAKALGSEFFGEYIKATTIISFFYIIIDFGLNTVFLREYHTKYYKYFNFFLGLRFYTALTLIIFATFLSFILCGFFTGFPRLVFYTILICSFSFVGQAVNLTAQSIFQLKLRMEKIAITQVAASFTSLILIGMFFISMEKNPYNGVLLAALFLSISSFVGAVVSICLLNLKNPIQPVLNNLFNKKMLHIGLPIGLTLIFNIVYFRADTIILSMNRSAGDVGSYGLAYKFFELFLILPTFIMNSLYPGLLRIQADKLKLVKNIKIIIFVMLGIGLVLLILGWIAAPWLIFIKQDFAGSVWLLRLLLLGLPLFYLTSPIMWVLIILKKQWQLSLVYAVSLIFSIVINLIFIPKYGGTAAAVSTGATEVIVLILELIIIVKLLWKKNI